MKKLHAIFLLFAIPLVLLTSGCKWSILSVTAPNCASSNQTITIYITGACQTEENSPTIYGLILQIPDSSTVLSAIATVNGRSLTLTENTQYASLYTPEPGHKVWVGTSEESEDRSADGTATVELSVGDCVGQFQIKAAAGSYRNGVWKNDDPLDEFNFLNITEQRYVDTISCDCASLTPWSPMASGTLNNLRGVWASSGSDVFAVGDDGTILHYDGSLWSIMTSWTTNWLDDVWGSSGSDVFAVGSGGTILHYDGTSWTSMTSGTTNTLHGVWGSSDSDVFAVGWYEGTILHYDGTSWTPMTSWTTRSLYGVWGSSSNDVFAVGEGGTIRHYDGSSWTPMTSGITSSLNGVWGSSGSDVFAVGRDGTIIHYDGTSWTPMTTGTTNWLDDVWGSSDSDVFAVGRGGTILHYVPTTLYVSKDSSCGGNSPCHTSIQNAIDAAPTLSSIEITQGTYTESITLNASKTLTLKGNWNADFTAQTSSTVLRQVPKASKGSLTLQELKIKP